MKCKYCGTEIANGSVFCEKCGKAVQIVPDYNEFEEDYLNRIITGEDSSKEDPSKKTEKKESAEKEKKLSPERKKIILFSSLALVLVLSILCGVLISFSVKNKRANSYDYQLGLAEEAYSQNNLKSAASYYEKALELWEIQYDGYNIEIRDKLIDIYQNMNDYNSALVLAQETVLIDPSDLIAYEALIDIYSSQGNVDAIVALSKDVTEPEVLKLFDDYMVSPPTFSLEEGEYDEEQTITISSEEDYQIYYTIDGSDPTSEGILYEEPIELDDPGQYTLSAVCKNSLGLYSNVLKAQYTISLKAPDMPAVSPDGGEFTEATTIYVQIPEHCTCYYTWDESEPTTYSDQCFGTIDLVEGDNILSVILIDTRTDLRSNIYRGRFSYYPEEETPEEGTGEGTDQGDVIAE